MASMFSTRHYPAGRELQPVESSVPDGSPEDANGPPSNVDATVDDTQPSDDPPADGDPTTTDDTPPQPTSDSSPPETTPDDHFVPSSALNIPPPATVSGTDPAVSTYNLLASSTVTSSTDTLGPTATGVLAQQGALGTNTGLSTTQKYIIAGVAGGGGLLLLLIALLLCCCCCRRRRAKKDVERPDKQPGQFTECGHGTCNGNHGQVQMEQKTPLRPFALRSDVPLTSKEGPQQHVISLKHRDSTESQKSAGSDASVDSAYSSGPEVPQHGRRRSQKRPPPLKLTSLITPVINGPQDNPRARASRSPPQVPTIVVESPQPEPSPGRMRRR